MWVSVLDATTLEHLDMQAAIALPETIGAEASLPTIAYLVECCIIACLLKRKLHPLQLLLLRLDSKGRLLLDELQSG
jgi:hypothetical protein